MDVWLEEIEREDLRTLKRWRNSDDVRYRSREYRFLNMVNQNDWFESMSRDRNSDMFLIMARDEDSRTLQNKFGTGPIGVCGLCYIDWVNRHAEVSIYIGVKKFRRKGIGSLVLTQLDVRAFGELNLEKLWAEVYELNKPGIALFEKCGYVLVGERKHHVKLGGVSYSSFLYEKYITEGFKYGRDNS